MMRKSDQSHAPQARHPQAGMGLIAAHRSWEQMRPEEALRPRATEREESLRRLADAIPEVFWIVALDPERVLYVSPSFERLWGFTAEALYREPRLWAETIHPEDRPKVTERYSRWIAGEDINYHDVEYRILQPGGDIRWIHDRGVLFRNEEGRPCGKRSTTPRCSRRSWAPRPPCTRSSPTSRKWRPPTPRCSSPARRAPGRSWWPGPFIGTPRERDGPS